MSENRRERQSSDPIRASLVDSSWSENPAPSSDPPPSSPPDVKTRQISAEKLAELVRSAESLPIDPSAARELPRYGSASVPADEPERSLEDLIPPDEQTKRIPYAALLGGSQAGRGGPSHPPTAPTFPVAKGDLTAGSGESQATPLPSFPRAESVPDQEADSSVRAAFDSEPLPAFARSPDIPLPQPVPPQSTPPADDGSKGAPALRPSRPPVAAPAPAPALRPSSPAVAAPALRPSRPPVAAPVPAPALRPSRPPVAAPVPAPALRPSRPPAAAPAPTSVATPAPVTLEPKPQVASHAVIREPSGSHGDILGALEAERGLLGALQQGYRLFGVRLPVWTLLVVTAAVVAVTMYLLSGAQPTPVAAAPVMSVTPRASVTPEQVAPKPEDRSVHALAARGEIEAIERLKQIPANARSIEDAIALARADAAQQLVALEPLVARLRDEPKALDDEKFRREFLEFVFDRRTYVEALAALAEVPTPMGPDALYEVWTGTKKSNEVTRLARDLVYTKDVRARASDALSVALQLRSAEDCQESRAAVLRALDYGDRRSFHLLGKLMSTRGCGPEKADDCYPCLRDADRVEKAIDAVRTRKPPL